MRKIRWTGNRFARTCCALLLALLLLTGTLAHADVLPGAFGEAIDALDEATRDLCIQAGDSALAQLIADVQQYNEKTEQRGYLQVLQTTILLPETQPDDATEIERKIWAEYYADVLCVVSFVAIDNVLNADDAPYASYSGLFSDYAVLRDGSVEKASLRAIRSKYFVGPVLPGVRVINMGGHFNGIHIGDDAFGASGATPVDSDSVIQVKPEQIAHIVVRANETTPYRWAFVLSDENVMQPVEDEYTQDANPRGLNGIGGNHRFSFKAVGTGVCTIDLYLVRIGGSIAEAAQHEAYVYRVEE